MQFHPEVNHTQHGADMLRRSLYDVCHASGDWVMEDYRRTAAQALRGTVAGFERVKRAFGPEEVERAVEDAKRREAAEKERKRSGKGAEKSKTEI